MGTDSNKRDAKEVSEVPVMFDCLIQVLVTQDCVHSVEHSPSCTHKCSLNNNKKVFFILKARELLNYTKEANQCTPYFFTDSEFVFLLKH